MSRFKGSKGILLLALIILLVIGYYYYLTNLHAPNKDEEQITTRVQEVLIRDLINNYPPSPKEVVKYYSDITQVFYNEKYTDKELYELAMKARQLLDVKLANNKTEDEYIEDLKRDIAVFKEKGCTISSYSLSPSIEVDYFSEDEQEFARLNANYYVRVLTNMSTIEEVYLLRKSEEGRWKIYGWDLAKNVKVGGISGAE